MRNLYFYLLVVVLGVGCGRGDSKNDGICGKFSFKSCFSFGRKEKEENDYRNKKLNNLDLEQLIENHKKLIEKSLYTEHDNIVAELLKNKEENIVNVEKRGSFYDASSLTYDIHDESDRSIQICIEASKKEILDRVKNLKLENTDLDKFSEILQKVDKEYDDLVRIGGYMDTHWEKIWNTMHSFKKTLESSENKYDNNL